MTAAHTFQSDSPAITNFLPILSWFVTLPWPLPVSSASLRTRKSRSACVRKLAVSGESGRTFQITSANPIGTRPSITDIWSATLESEKILRTHRISIASPQDLSGHLTSELRTQANRKRHQKETRQRRIQPYDAEPRSDGTIALVRKLPRERTRTKAS